MEDVFTIKIKTQPDTRNLYPSERRYSASTVSGLAWVHIALAATSFLLACLALVSPNEGRNDGNSTDTSLASNETSNTTLARHDNGYILVLAPTLITVFGLAAGVASVMASVKWYIDRNITWLFIMSILSTFISLTSFIMIAVWFIATSEGDISEFYKDKVPFKDFLVVKHTDVVERNSSHMMILLNANDKEESSSVFTKHVLSINIMVAAFLELLWSILSVKISYKGMRNRYKDDGHQRRGNCVSVVTKIKGNNMKKLPRNGKLIPQKPDLIENYPSKKIKRIFMAQDENGFYLKNHNNKAKQNTETSSEFYKERMINFLNRCASMEGVSNPDVRTPSVQSEAALNPIPEVASVEINLENEVKDTSTASWGDAQDVPVYNQNTLNLEKIFDFNKKQNDTKKSEGMSEINE